MNIPYAPKVNRDDHHSAQRKKLWRKIFPRQLSFTREGRVYVLITLGVGFAAVNTDNNLLFLVLGMMLGIIVISGVMSEITLRHIEVKRSLPSRVDANLDFPVELALLNKKNRATSFSVELRDEINGVLFKRRCFFLKVEPNEQRSIVYKGHINHRGLVTFNGTIISTRFPFGLFEKKRFVPIKDTIVAWPAKVPVSLKANTLTPGEGEGNLKNSSTGADFLELREMVEGDDPRRIHWRATARAAKLMVRESELDARGHIQIILNAALTDASKTAAANVELNIQTAGSLIRKIAASGLNVRLVTAGPTILESNDRTTITPLLDHLAHLDPFKEATLPAPVGKHFKTIVIGSRPWSDRNPPTPTGQESTGTDQ